MEYYWNRVIVHSQTFIYPFIQKYLFDLYDVIGTVPDTKAKYVSTIEFLPLMNLQSGWEKQSNVLSAMFKMWTMCYDSPEERCSTQMERGQVREEVRASFLVGTL